MSLHKQCLNQGMVTRIKSCSWGHFVVTDFWWGHKPMNALSCGSQGSQCSADNQILFTCCGHWVSNDLMCGHGSQPKFRQSLASFPGTKRRRRRRKGLVSAVCAALNHYGIPLLPHTIDILLYICDTNTATTCYTVCSLL